MRHIEKRICYLVLAILPFTLSGCVSQSQTERMADLFEQYPVSEMPNDWEKQGVLATYYGTSTIVFDDGVSSVLIDGFFSRPSIIPALFGQMQQIKQDQSNAIFSSHSKLEGVVVLHSHHDHAMDAPCIANYHDAYLIGSDSTLKILCGSEEVKRPKSPIFSQSEVSEPIVLGNFTVTLIQSVHGELPGIAAWYVGIEKHITEKLVMPSRLSKFKEGDNYAVLIEHPKGNSLVVGSAAVISENIEKATNRKPIEIDWLFLGVGKLSKQASEQYLPALLATKPKNMTPIHWDSFSTQPQNGELPLPTWPFGNAADAIGLVLSYRAQYQSANSETGFILLNYQQAVCVGCK